MNETPSLSPTVRRHKVQFVWQILVPIILVVLIGLAAGGLVVWATFAGEGNPRLWADISLIWMLAPMLLMALISAVILGGLIYGIARMLKVLPRFTLRAQELANRGAEGVHQLADGIVKPFIWVEQAKTALQSGILFLLGKK